MKRKTLIIMVITIFLMSTVSASAEGGVFNISSKKGGFNYIPHVEELTKQVGQPTVEDMEKGWIPDNDNWGVSENPIVREKSEEQMVQKEEQPAVKEKVTANLGVSAEVEVLNNSSEKRGFNYIPPIEDLTKQDVKKSQPTIEDMEKGWIPDADVWDA